MLIVASKNRSAKSGDPGTDADNLALVARGDRDAFAALFEDYHPRLFRFLFRLTHSHGEAEELANDVLLTVWNDAGRFRGDARVSTWIFGIAYRQALSHMRKRRLKYVALKDDHAITDSAGPRLEKADWVQQGIEALPPKQRLTIMLVYFLGLSCDETAAATGVPTSTVKTRMFHARRKLKMHLDGSRRPARWNRRGEADA